MSRQTKYNKEYMRRNKLYGIIYKGSRCMDCNMDLTEFPECADFDHRPGTKKLAPSMGQLGTISWKRFRREIDKCDLVCANCHRKRTKVRQNG